MKKSYSRGFTLIELLVVIAIIGILASVVLVSLNSARNKGKDARIISSVQQIRTLAEGGYNNGLYLDFIGDSDTTYNETVAGALNTAGPNNTAVAQLVADMTANAGSVVYMVTEGSTNIGVSAYAVYGALPSSPSGSTKYFCLDSTGKTNQYASAASTVTCPAN
ncbi:MAG: type II secretion system protein [Candidatus Paceibacterota bacterium]|jgi:prepilin-type N-terminal cleavage/methylation domain-containing protein